MFAMIVKPNRNFCRESEFSGGGRGGGWTKGASYIQITDHKIRPNWLKWKIKQNLKIN